MTESPGVTITFTADQALVFFEWLAREDDRSALPTEHRAEQFVPWAIEAQLENVLREPFQPDYKAKLEAARERIVQGFNS